MDMPSITSKQCSGKYSCGKTLPIEQFYRHPNGHYQSMCKSCQRKYKRMNTGKPQPNEHEVEFVHQCLQRGIYAVTGVRVQGYDDVTWSDVICWGFVRIEVKYGESLNGGYNFRMTHRQQQNGFDADIVCLIAGNDYYFFPPDHKVFFRHNGTRKSAVAWRPGAVMNKRNLRFGVPLCDEVMEAHKDNWCMIESVKIQKIKQLQSEANQ